MNNTFEDVALELTGFMLLEAIGYEIARAPTREAVITLFGSAAFAALMSKMRSKPK